MELKVPFLADRQLESAATELLRKYAKWKGTPPRPPIPVDDIVEGLLEDGTSDESILPARVCTTSEGLAEQLRASIAWASRPAVVHAANRALDVDACVAVGEPSAQARDQNPDPLRSHRLRRRPVVILEDFDAASFARAELSADPYCDPRALGAQIARTASQRGGRYFEATDLPSACVWSPPAGYDASPGAVERRIAAGEESERDYEAARFADDERAGEYDLSDNGGEW